jgi:hypothetical protein
MTVQIISVFKEDEGWFVATSARFGPYSREVAEKLAKGLEFAIRSSGGVARIVIGDVDGPPPCTTDSA